MTVETESRTRRGSAVWAVALCAAGLVFDGYDLVVYGALVPLFLRSPDEIGPIDAGTAGALGSYTLVGVMVGALASGAAADRWGRRPVLLTGYVWFSIGMAATAMTGAVGHFAAARGFTGVGIGVVVAATGALVSEVAPPQRRQLYTTLAYCGIPLGSVLGTLAALGLADVVVADTAGWRILFWLGALPLVTLVPLAMTNLPESPVWEASRCTSSAADGGAVGLRGLATRAHALPALLLGVVSALSLLLIFALGTWLPELLGRAGFDEDAALISLTVLNVGAIVGALSASLVADRFGPRRVVTSCFVVGSAALTVLAASPGGPVLLTVVALVGLGTTGSQILVIGLAAATFPASVRGAGIAWCTGFGRLGGIAGPAAVGALVAGGLTSALLFAVLAAVALSGGAVTLLVGRSRSRRSRRPLDRAARTRSLGTTAQR